MTSKILPRGSVDKALPGDGARILLVNKDPRERACFGAALQRAGYRIRSASSFTEGALCLEREPYDLILLDQGSSGFEGREVLLSAMELDSEVPVLVLARSYDRSCYEEAMQAGAVDYVEGLLSEAEIVALLETFTSRRTGSRGILATRVKGTTPDKKGEISKKTHLKWIARHDGFCTYS